MIVLDSNIWIAYFYESDTQHAKARRLIHELSEPMAIPEYVFGEVCTILAQRSGKAVADSFVDAVTRNEQVGILPFENEEFWRTIKLFREFPKKYLSFIDLSLLLLARTFRVVTFDRQLEKVITKQR